MQDYENNEKFFLGSHQLFLQVGIWIEDASQLRLRVHAFPQVAMLLGQLDEIPNAPSPGLKEKPNADQKRPHGQCAGLDERKPIVAHPIRESHAYSIASFPEVSSSEESYV